MMDKVIGAEGKWNCQVTVIMIVAERQWNFIGPEKGRLSYQYDALFL